MEGSAITGAARLRSALLEAGYTVDGVLSRLGSPAFAALSRRLFVPAHRALSSGASDAALDHLISCFLLGEPTATGLWRQDMLSDLKELGLVRVLGDQVLPAVEIHPYGEPDTDWFLVSDLGHPQDPDHVLGLGGASVTLARITPRSPTGSALDIGCGAGVQALHAARHCARVVATDTNPRAIRYTWLSAALSGLDLERLDLRLGSLFEPVAGECFDLIVSNPPFVISPARHFTYRDAGLPADQLSRRIVRGAAAHLAPGGTAVVLANWLHEAGLPWWQRPCNWLDGTGVSGLVVQRDAQPIVDYAEVWLRDAGLTSGPQFEAQLGDWLDEFAAQGAQAVGFGWVILRANSQQEESQLEGHAESTTTWVLPEDLSEASRLPAAHEVVEYLAACAAVDGLAATSLLGSPVSLAAGVSVTRIWDGVSQGQQGARLGRPGIVGPGGWRPDILVDPLLLEALTRRADTGSVAPRQPIGEILDEQALAADIDPLDLLAAWLVTIRELLRVGIVRIG